MNYKIFQVDAFTDEVFKGNPAAVIPLDKWLADEVLQKIALENNLSETAFCVPTDKGFHLRWFTPTVEVDLCGHATLATSYVIFNELGCDKDKIIFESLSGDLIVEKTDHGFRLDFPVWAFEELPTHEDLNAIMGAAPKTLYKSDDWVAVYETEAQVRDLDPDMFRLEKFTEARGIIATAPAEDESTDFVSRWFGPQSGVPEDPVTGSAHCVLTPYWSEKLSKTTLNAHQVSAREGKLLCELKEGRVLITGTAILYMKGEITI